MYNAELQQSADCADSDISSQQQQQQQQQQCQVVTSISLVSYDVEARVKMFEWLNR